MGQKLIAPAKASFEEVLFHREKFENNPNLLFRDHAVLKDGPRAYKVAQHLVVVDHGTGEIHHHVLRLETYRHRPGSRTTDGGWYLDIPYSITLDDDDGNEIARLLTFLKAICGDRMPGDPGDYLVLPVEPDTSHDAVRRLLSAVPDASKLDVVSEALAAVKGEPEVLKRLAERVSGDPDAQKDIAAAFNLARFSEALEEFGGLIDANASERAFQAHLEEHPWIFGSEYSELLDRRTWTRDKQQDFMLRRTTDGYLEIVEIKTPLDGDALFRYDPSHDSHFPRSEVTKVVGQVMRYLDDIDADRFRIEAHDGENVNKIRAKIIIGRDGDERQMTALRVFNSHLHRIEVLTFDQLLRTGQRVLAYLEHSMVLPRLD